VDKQKDETFIGADKKIAFGGSTAGHIEIPSGLRAPVAREPVPRARPAPPETQPRPEPEFVGADKKIVFGGETSGQIHIPAGLRRPEKTTNSA
jgi:hypothetical protein